MSKKSWKRRWEEELQTSVPALREDVKNAPIESVDTSCSTPEKIRFKERKPRLIACLYACAACFLALCAALPFLFRSADTPIAAQAAEVIAVEVNPEAMFTVDEKGKVTAVVAANEDADVVLSESRAKEMRGKTLTAAVELFVDYSARLGYLDLSVPDAVRVTSCSKNSRVSEVNEVLTEYFRNKGAYIVVVEEILSAEAFGKRLGLEDCVSETELVKKVEKLNSRFFEREKIDENADLGTLYREKVPEQAAENYFRAALNLSAAQLEEKSELLTQLYAKNEEIIGHENNLLGLDFWTLSAMEEDWLVEDLVALMDEAQDLLNAYKKKYGVTIESFLGLEEEMIKLTASPLVKIREWLADFTFQTLEENFAEILAFFEELGVDVSKGISLYELPKNYAEYLEKLGGYLDSYSQDLEREYLSLYAKYREKIEKSDYEDYVEGLKKNYGSLSAYWESLQN
ncbi:MAG: hypothetical protein IJF44_04425 [Clostridia bacterium]|nr:hypothetical protein [Clostridia bacterium]